MPPKEWGYIGTTKIIELNPEKKEEALERGFRVLAELKMRRLREEKAKSCFITAKN